MSKREGPTTAEVCNGCKWLRKSGWDMLCRHPARKESRSWVGDYCAKLLPTPDWCPARKGESK